MAKSAFYQIVVPATLRKGQPVIGWNLTVTETEGSPTLRVRQGLLPDNGGNDGTSPFDLSEAIVVAPYLTPGTWYVEVKGSGITAYTLTSSNLQLKRPAWIMPAVGAAVTTTGLLPHGTGTTFRRYRCGYEWPAAGGQVIRVWIWRKARLITMPSWFPGRITVRRASHAAWSCHQRQSESVYSCARNAADR